MNALELIKRIKALEDGYVCASDYLGAVDDIIALIKQMEKEKWEKAWSEFDINKPSKIADNFFDDKREEFNPYDCGVSSKRQVEKDKREEFNPYDCGRKR